MMSDPLWFKDAVIYQLHVKTFADSNGDGIGDFKGLHEKLSYFEDLGVTAIWMLPFYPSPLRDDGYDIADYYSVNPSYGTIEDFRALLEDAHRRNIRIITELVLNHTSDQNPWFQRRAGLRQGHRSGTSTSGAIIQKNIARRGSSSKISKLRIGPGIR
jgi:maltose alpha-D-glucosyltransferase/alpha-amylase